MTWMPMFGWAATVSRHASWSRMTSFPAYVRRRTASETMNRPDTIALRTRWRPARIETSRSSLPAGTLVDIAARM